MVFIAALVFAASCIDKHVDNGKAIEKYTESFNNRRTVTVNIQSQIPGEYYAVYYEYPYDEEALCKQLS